MFNFKQNTFYINMVSNILLGVFIFNFTMIGFFITAFISFITFDRIVNYLKDDI